jgi:hypothetical protein
MRCLSWFITLLLGVVLIGLIGILLLMIGYRNATRVTPIEPFPGFIALPDVVTPVIEQPAIPSDEAYEILHANHRIYDSRTGNLRFVANETIRLVHKMNAMQLIMSGFYERFSPTNVVGLSDYLSTRWSMIIVTPLLADHTLLPVSYPVSGVWDGRTYSHIVNNTYIEDRNTYITEDSLWRRISPVDTSGMLYAEHDVMLPQGGYEEFLECWHYVRGYITFLTDDPLTGYFQFFCQFDSTDYRQISGRFWE